MDGRRRFVCLLPLVSAVAAALGPQTLRAADEPDAADAIVLPSRYIVNIPPVEHFCPPIATAFHDAVVTEQVVNRKYFRSHPNGGYGVAMMEEKGVPLLHTGADLGWYRVGVPVYAVADGVVRTSMPGIKQLNRLLKLKISLPSGPVDYGNLIIIEHRTADDDYFLSLYGHLGNDRLVRAGDIVTAGQVIGTIGKEAGDVNGGYKPHLHFAIHEGRYFEPGMELFRMQVNGQPLTVRLIELGEVESRVALSADVPDLTFEWQTGQPVTLRRAGDSYLLPSFILWSLGGGSSSSMPGYAPTVQGFRDPVQFLRDARADTHAAPIYQTTAIHPLSQLPVVGQTAPELTVDEWLHLTGDAPTLAGLRGKVVCLVFYQTSCPGSASHGFPTLADLAGRYAKHPDVQVIGMHVTTRDFRRGTPQLARKAAAGLPCPVGYAGDIKRPPEVAGFGVRATPWVVLIDRQGTIQFSNAVIRTAALRERIGELVAAP
jgi:murein DD-endopeptidase MepM/ murein hydrolase activator NlpD